ncbi:hypothetical protein HMPREF1139_2020 [Campylobacter sp. FOBRC14]|nr:hypothetical protein HMPREF1139_2020 [Campylobacter sp. FOBRC14]
MRDLSSVTLGLAWTCVKAIVLGIVLIFSLFILLSDFPTLVALATAVGLYAIIDFTYHFIKLRKSILERESLNSKI